MSQTQQRSMARSRSWLTASLLYACALAAVATEDPRATQPADSEGELAKRFIATLLRQPSAAIGKPEGCLASKPGAAATVGRELGAIFGNFIDADWSFAIGASCERDASPTRQFCKLVFFHKSDEDEASTGFIFRGNPADGSIDIRTLECFQTP
jgi:hypothetical protein